LYTAHATLQTYLLRVGPITLTMILEVGQRMIMYSVMTVRLYT